MPFKDGALSPQERTIAEVFAVTGDKRAAAKAAGYKHITTAHNALARPGVQAEVVRIQTQKLVTEGLALAVQAHFELLSPKTPAGARVQAVKLMYDRVLGPEKGASDNDIATMTPAQMAEEFARLTREAADRAKILEGVAVELEEEPKGGVFD